MHQLVDSIRRQGGEAYLAPMPGYENKSPAQRYSHYDVSDCLPRDGDTIVVPEIAVSLLDNFPNSDKYIWWLAAGYHEADATHLCQSEYAGSVINNNSQNFYKLSDYTVLYEKPDIKKDGSIAYSGRKGAEYMVPVMERMTKTKFVKIDGMSRNEVAEVLSRADIYLDLGSHPGKDRMPREAALMDALVITSTEGSAGHHEDVPIATKADRANPEEVINTICAVWTNRGYYLNKQKEYVSIIKKEKEVFDEEVRRIFL